AAKRGASSSPWGWSRTAITGVTSRSRLTRGTLACATQMRHIVLLRGINLGARNRVSMPELREVLRRAGFEEVQTYLQSGNVVLAAEEPPDKVAARCRRAITRALDLEIEVLARTREELAAVVGRNPLAKVATDPKRYQVSFLERE